MLAAPLVLLLLVTVVHVSCFTAGYRIRLLSTSDKLVGDAHTLGYRQAQRKLVLGGTSIRSSPSDDESGGSSPGEELSESEKDTSIVNVQLNDELKNCFMSYAMSTILGRALPDARDGLKPVHRRVLYAMQMLNLTPDSTYRKCARIVGEVLGKFHPHGDQSVYDALVRMSQDFVMLHPLISGHGNFGSVDNDPPAAMRYTEAKLSSLSSDAMLSDIKEDTVDFVPNFDDQEEEPLVLPAKIPMLLLNGASGIAVGMATNIPPHNLGELIDGVVGLIRNPELSDEELMKVIPAPDFPTGGEIIGKVGAHSMYKTGRGSVPMRAKSHIEVITSTSRSGTKLTRTAIIVTELPYMTNKAALLEKMADMVNDKKLDGISDLRDESDRDGIRVVIELKRDANPAIVQNNLYKKTALQTSFSGNMLALVDDGTQPKRVTLRDLLNIFIDFRFKTVRRRTAHQLKKVQSRDHIVQGLIMALSKIDKIIKVIRDSEDVIAAKVLLISEEFGFSVEQAESVLGLTLRRLTSMEGSKLNSEHDDLVKQIDVLSNVMNSETEVFNIIVNESLEIKKKHAVPRRTAILGEQLELCDQDLLANDRSVILITGNGYIKRIPIEEFQAQSRGGKGKAGARLSTDQDSVQHFFTCNDHDTVLFVTDRGIAYTTKAFQIPLGSRIAKGTPLPQVLPIGQNEVVTSLIPIDSFRDEESLILLTSNGYVKKTPINAFKTVSARGLTIISLGDDDSLRWARRCNITDEILIATRDGFGMRMEASSLRETGRKSRGVRALNLRDGDRMADMDIILKSNPIETGPSEPQYVLAVTEKGYGKRISIEEFRVQKRGGRGVIIIKFKTKAGGGRGKTTTLIKPKTKEVKGETDALSSMRICSAEDEVVFSTERGTIMRQLAGDISVQSRSATGVKLQKLPIDDSIVMVDVVPPDMSTPHSSIMESASV